MTRRCPAALAAFLDSKNLQAAHPTQILVEAAQACVGICEVGGDNKGPMVELFQSAISRPLEQSWCLDFVQAMVSYVELKTGITSSLAATELVLNLWDCEKGYSEVIQPQAGDIVIWQFKGTVHGHCGIVTGSDDTHWLTIEGNTSDSVDIDRNGDGVYEKRRQKGGSKTMLELGFLSVF